MSNTLLTALELLTAFFACAGAVYLFKELWDTIGRKKIKTRAVLYISLSNDEKESIETLIHIASFFNNSNACRYIAKIVATNVPESLLVEEYELQTALKIPLVFSKKSISKGRNDIG